VSLVFYYAPMSSASITALVLEELGVPCERVKLDIQKKETRTPEFLKVNPNGRVPVIVHDGTAIWESVAITMYLGETFGVEKGLYPPPGPRRGEAMKWIAWANVTLGEAVFRWTRNTMAWYPAEEQNAKAGASAEADIANCLRVLERSLDGRQFLAGDYTLADTHVAGLIGWLRSMKIDFAPYERINAWTGRCRARPAYARVTAPGGE